MMVAGRLLAFRLIRRNAFVPFQGAEDSLRALGTNPEREIGPGAVAER